LHEIPPKCEISFGTATSTKASFWKFLGKFAKNSGGFEPGSPDLEVFLLLGRQIRAGLQKKFYCLSPVLFPFNANSFMRSLANGTTSEN